MEHNFRFLVHVDILFDDLFVNDVSKIYPAAKLYQAEIFDMYGIEFGEKSSNGKRRLLSSISSNHYPLLKDFNQELASYSEDKKERPLKKPELYLNGTKPLQTEWKEYGVYEPNNVSSSRFLLEYYQARIKSVDVEIGYTHRGLEKALENCPYHKGALISEKIQSSNFFFGNLLWFELLEVALDKNIPERVKALRMVFSELVRIHNHLHVIQSLNKCLTVDINIRLIGKLKQLIHQLFINYNNSTMLTNVNKLGGVIKDLPRGWITDCLEAMKILDQEIDELEKMMTRSFLWVEKSLNTGLTPDKALAFSMSGPNLRACGINYDLRKVSPRYYYEETDFDIPLGISGNTYDRYLVRLEEVKQSIKIISQVIDNLPIGPFYNDDTPHPLNFGSKSDGKNSYELKLKANSEYYHSLEASTGELGLYIATNDEGKVDRAHFRTPSFAMVNVLENIFIGNESEDFILALNSFEFDCAESDR